MPFTLISQRATIKAIKELVKCGANTYNQPSNNRKTIVLAEKQHAISIYIMEGNLNAKDGL